jgi:transposase
MSGLTTSPLMGFPSKRESPLQLKRNPRLQVNLGELRTHVCLYGKVLDRDHNAALNILAS